MVSSQVGGSTGGSSGAAGGSASGGKPCAPDTKIAAPTASKDCALSVRNIDPLITCGQAECAVRKALDLTCGTLPGSASLSATTDRTSLFSITYNPDDNSAKARLMTVTATESQVEDVSAINQATLSSYQVTQSSMSSSSSGKRWFFASDYRSLLTIRETNDGWVRSSIPIKQNSGPYLDARMVDDDTGYLTYAMDFEDYAPHLVTWNGSCWTDRKVAERGRPASTVLAVDEKKQPWLAWFYGDEVLYLRAPGGDTQNLLTNLIGSAPAVTLTWPLRLLPGGLDGTTPFPLVAVGSSDGVRLFTRQIMEPGWRSTRLPDPPAIGTTQSDCPSASPSPDYSADPCLGQTSCTARLTASAGFDLARTQSGRTFAAWVVYSSQGTYGLEKAWTGGELPLTYCQWKETSGTGTAELVLMRLTEAEPILSHFRFDMGGAILGSPREVRIAARGDTLLVAAQLGGSKVPTLTYIEIDSTLLP